jgi:tripartite motif-containing protein 71
MKKQLLRSGGILLLFAAFAINVAKAQTFLYQFPLSSTPVGIAIDASENVYVSNATNSYIEEYTRTGALIRQWSVGVSGIPEDMAVDNSGNLWVADYYNKVDKYYNGVLQSSFTSANGAFNNPRGVAIGYNGYVYVADASNFRITIMNSAGGYVSQIGTTGVQGDGIHAPLGNLGYPTDMVVDASGNVYVVDQSNNRIVKYDSTGAYVTAWGSSTLYDPWSIILDNSGNLLVANSGDNTIVQYSTSGTLLTQFGGSGSGNGTFAYPPGIAVDKTTGNIFVTDYGNKLVQVFGNPCTGRTYDSVITWNGTTGGGLMAIDNVGNIYYPGQIDGKVYKYDKSGNLLLTIGTGVLVSPQGVAVDATGNIFVTDTNRVDKFDSSGTHIGGWGGAGVFSLPFGIAVDNAGNVYVTDNGNNNVQKFSNTGTLITSWGSLGYTGNGTFYEPRGITVDVSQNVYVVDLGNRLIQKFSNTGSFLAEWGSNGSGNGQFNNQSGVAADNSGNIYVTDSYNNRVEKFTNTGGYLTQWATTGTAGGGPIGVVVDANCNVYVGHNALIEKFAIVYNSRIAASDDNTIDNNSIASNTAVQVFPNPSQGNFNISVPGASNFNVALYNAIGEQVSSETAAGASYTLSNPSLPNGFYILHVTSNGVTNQIKVEVNK